MHKRFGVPLYRLFFGGLAAAAVITQYLHGVNTVSGFQPINFFSYFTIQSNILAALIFLVAGLAGLSGKQGSQLALLRGAATFYMTATGIVYALLLSGLEVSLQTTIPWVNTVLHYIMPMAVLADWLVNRPARKVVFKEAVLWLSFPAAYVAYSLVRGLVVDWYPYPFLNPSENGYWHVAFICTCIAAALVGITWFLAWSTRWRTKA